MEDNRLYYLLRFPFSWKYDIISRCSLLARLFRLDIRYGVKISLYEYIVVRDNKLYEIDTRALNISSGYKLIRGSRPLNILNLNNVDGFDNGLYFGEYFFNPDKNFVAIYKRTSEDRWDKVYTFMEGEINHIHKLIPDAVNQCVWILTGDWDNAAAIWQAKNNFREVKAICRGNQMFRSCIAFPFNNGLLYATDTPMEKNAVYCLSENSGIWETEYIVQMNGSAIYSTNVKDVLIFSTVVESDGREPFLKNMITCTRGEGIIENKAFVYGLILPAPRESNTACIYEIVSQGKDFLPFVLFQFGSISFPSGHNDSNYLPTYNIGTKKYDLSLVLYKLTDNKLSEK